jgi:hypothetical protein
MTKRPTPEQKWILQVSRISPVEGGYLEATIIQPWPAGHTIFGHQTRVIDACKSAGWLDKAGHLTEAGLNVLASIPAVECPA